MLSHGGTVGTRSNTHLGEILVFISMTMSQGFFALLADVKPAWLYCLAFIFDDARHFARASVSCFSASISDLTSCLSRLYEDP